MAKRIGVAREKALLEALKRSINLNGTTLTGMTLTSATLTRPTLTQPTLTQRTYSGDNESESLAVTMTTDDYVPGSVIYFDAGLQVNNDYDITYTLPAASEGLSYTFVCTGTAGADGSGAVAVTIQAGSAILGAMMNCNDGRSGDGSGDKTSIVWDDDKCEQGTTIRCLSDGNNWYATGETSAGKAEVTVS